MQSMRTKHTRAQAYWVSARTKKPRSPGLSIKWRAGWVPTRTGTLVDVPTQCRHGLIFGSRMRAGCAAYCMLRSSTQDSDSCPSDLRFASLTSRFVSLLLGLALASLPSTPVSADPVKVTLCEQWPVEVSPPADGVLVARFDQFRVDVSVTDRTYDDPAAYSFKLWDEDDVLRRHGIAMSTPQDAIQAACLSAAAYYDTLTTPSRQDLLKALDRYFEGL